jgi:hypothetical protein
VARSRDARPAREPHLPLRSGVRTFRDVTEARAAAAAFHESAAHLDLAVTAHRIGIFDCTSKPGEVFRTAQEEELFGLRLEASAAPTPISGSGTPA